MHTTLCSYYTLHWPTQMLTNVLIDPLPVANMHPFLIPSPPPPFISFIAPRRYMTAPRGHVPTPLLHVHDVSARHEYPEKRSALQVSAAGSADESMSGHVSIGRAPLLALQTFLVVGERRQLA